MASFFLSATATGPTRESAALLQKFMALPADADEAEQLRLTVARPAEAQEEDIGKEFAEKQSAVPL